MSLSGKSAVVTGAAMGIGRAITEVLLQNGAKVALLDVDETAGRSLKEVLDREYPPERTLFLSCDVESEEQIKAALQETAETFGGIDIMCNNAGILNEAAWEKAVSINMMGVIRGTYLALEHMSKLSGGRGGVIVNMASMAGLGPLPSCPVYRPLSTGWSASRGHCGRFHSVRLRRARQRPLPRVRRNGSLLRGEDQPGALLPHGRRHRAAHAAPGGHKCVRRGAVRPGDGDGRDAERTGLLLVAERTGIRGLPFLRPVTSGVALLPRSDDLSCPS
uniref:15-hydroxyprostaglandin dehydrogenase n=1 Tax=Gasterosteus aculeatus aculeatus TaxID=481459 RepID=G3N994_GASAC